MQIFLSFVLLIHSLFRQIYFAYGPIYFIYIIAYDDDDDDKYFINPPGVIQISSSNIKTDKSACKKSHFLKSASVMYP